MCNDSFFEIQPGLCGFCPSFQYWNGEKCSHSKSCLTGYTWKKSLNCCVLSSTQCGPNAHFDGFRCVCDDSYNLINSRCQKCPSGTNFDGIQCIIDEV